MSTFSLEIIATDKVFYRGKCQCVILPAIDGELAVMAHHEEMAISIVIGTIRYKLEDGTWVDVVVSNGMAMVASNRVSVTVYTAERPEDIDILRAKEAAERAEEQLRQKQSIQEYHQSQASLARALTRIKEASKSHPLGL